MNKRNYRGQVVDLSSYKDEISQNEPHEVSELICVSCMYRYLGVYHHKALLKDMKCPNCHKLGGIIKTGQTLEDT